MEIFVLTSKEEYRSRPVGTTTKESIANRWSAQAGGNDWYRFVLDDLDHLGFEENGPHYEQPVEIDFSPPLPRRLDDKEPADAMRELSDFLGSLAESMDQVIRAVQG